MLSLNPHVGKFETDDTVGRERTWRGGEEEGFRSCGPRAGLPGEQPGRRAQEPGGDVRLRCRQETGAREGFGRDRCCVRKWGPVCLPRRTVAGLEKL